MKLRFRTWERPNSAMTLLEHSASRRMEASASQWVPDPPRPLLHTAASSQRRRQQPGHCHLHTSPSQQWSHCSQGQEGAKGWADIPLHHTPERQTTPQGHNTFQRHQTPALCVFHNKIQCLFTQSGLICPKKVAGLTAVVPGSNVLTSSRAQCSPSSLLTLEPSSDSSFLPTLDPAAHKNNHATWKSSYLERDVLFQSAAHLLLQLQ